MTSKMGSDLRASECLTLEMIFLPIRLCVTAGSALQNVRYCFPTIHGGSGVMEHAMLIVSPLRRSVQQQQE